MYFPVFYQAIRTDNMITFVELQSIFKSIVINDLNREEQQK